MKDKKAKTVLYSFIGIVNDSKRKPNKLWVDQGKEFYNSLIQKCWCIWSVMNVSH